MDRTRLEQLRDVYRDGLLNDTLPFWTKHSVDREHGGFMFCLDRDGAVVDTDKGVWQQCRFTWLLAALYNTVEPREEWLALARHGVEFIRQHCFDTDGRMLFQVTRRGAPLRQRRYLFTESFGAIALAAYARASGDERAASQARELFRLMIRFNSTPGLIPPKVDPATRPSKSLAVPMITLITARILRDDIGDTFAAEWIDRSIDEIRSDFVKPDLEVVMETVGPKGQIIDHFDGRTLNPGHALEAAWFLLDEAWHRGQDEGLQDLGMSMVDWMWKRGWDEEHGGILYYRDLHGLPVQEYWHDMKFWWPHNEAILATLLAYRATGSKTHADRHQLVHDWAHHHFADPEHGEWFGYLHRDGRRSSSLKGNLWKGPFHLPRMQLVAWQVIEGMIGE